MSNPTETDQPSLIPESAHQRAQQQHLQEKEQAEELAQKNHNFLQVQKRNLKEFRRLIDKSPVAAKLIFLLAEKMNRQNALMCSFKTLEEITGLSRATLSRAIAVLKKEQWINVLKVGSANAYIVNYNVFWQDSADKKNSHAVFGATIIASKSEQDSEDEEYKEQWKGVSLRHFPFMDAANDIKDIELPKEAENE